LTTSEQNSFKMGTDMRAKKIDRLESRRSEKRYKKIKISRHC